MVWFHCLPALAAVNFFDDDPPWQVLSESTVMGSALERVLFCPDLGTPSYDEATLAAYFHAALPAIFDDAVAGPEPRRLAIEAPDILAAVADVDRSQIRDSLERCPFDRLRLRMASARWNGLARLRRGG
jgi:hypothetical protein